MNLLPERIRAWVRGWAEEGGSLASTVAAFPDAPQAIFVRQDVHEAELVRARIQTLQWARRQLRGSHAWNAVLDMVIRCEITRLQGGKSDDVPPSAPSVIDPP